MSSRSDTLHCVVRAPHDGDAFAMAIGILSAGDCLLLLQDGVRAAHDLDTVLPAGVQGYVLGSDLRKRSACTPLNPHFSIIDEAQFVALAANTARQVCWA